LAELGSKINKIFYRDSISKSFASLVYIEMTSNSGKISILNAGHPPPLILNTSGVRSIAKGDVALGIVEKSKYQVKDLTIKKGDFFIIYSDGVTEAQNDEGEFYGKTKLTNLLKTLVNLSAYDAGIKILESVQRFVDEVPFYDDLSLLILKRL
jgi:sigma-B regulation protein RsbU (phosphoserine phosphatase)